MLTSLGFVPAYFASASATCSVGLIGSFVAATTTFRPDTVTVELRNSVLTSAAATPSLVGFAGALAVNVNVNEVLVLSGCWNCTLAGGTLPYVASESSIVWTGSATRCSCTLML